MTKIGRNDPCPCGSGKKFKKCHIDSPFVVPPGVRIVSYAIELHASHGAPWVDDRPDNPLARATKNLLETGQRFTIAAHATVIFDGAVRWLGMFVLSAAKRLVFFPGFAQGFDRLAMRADAAHAYDVEFMLDHVTLDADRRRWHFTQKVGDELHRPAGRTLNVGGGRTLWFGLTTSQPWELRRIAAKTVAHADAPSNNRELQHRVDTLLKAVSRAASAELQLAPRPATPSALHFVATVGPPGARLHAGPQLCSPPIIGTLAPTEVTACTGRVRLATDLEVQLLAAWVPGEVPSGFVLTPPA